MTPPSRMIRVLVADDQDMVRTALRAVIDRREDLQVVAEAADGHDAVRSAFALRPDVVVMDVRMPGMTGVEAADHILGRWPHLSPSPRILVLTTFDLDEYVYASLRAGATGFLLKNTSPDQLAEAIRTVAADEAMLAPTVTHRLIRTFAALPAALLDEPPQHSTERKQPLDSLTPRERHVLALLAEGLSNAQIAHCLHLSEATVKSRVNRILTRLGVNNRVQAAIIAREATHHRLNPET